MSKYTRLNKINHFHDSGSSEHLLLNRTLQNSDMSNMIDTSSDIMQKSLPTRRLRSTSTMKTRTMMKLGKGTELAFFLTLTILLILLVHLNGVYSLNCYHCSSVDDPGCDEAFASKANYTDTDCAKHLESDKSVKVCRKIVQYIEAKKVVIRSCGYIDDHEEKDKKPMCYKRSGTFAIMMESCNCYEDNCNHSTGLVPDQSVLLLTISSLMFLYLFSHNYHESNQLTQRTR